MENIVDRIQHADTDDPMYPYFESLPVGCYSYLCKIDQLTLFGMGKLAHYLSTNLATLLYLNDETRMWVSTIYSRRWGLHERNETWLIPIVDMFNYNYSKTALGVFYNQSFYVTTGNHSFTEGEQVFVDYGFQDATIPLMIYGIEDTPFQLSCEEFLAMRILEPRDQRIECIANNTYYDVEFAIDEQMLAQELNDTDMLEGITLWLARHNNSDDTNTLNPR